jgi:putative endopeptidase
MRRLVAVSAAAVLALVSAASVARAKSKDKPAPASSTGIDETAIDRKADPCDDFYQYACGEWNKRTPIPEDKPAWYRSFSEIDERNEKALRDILTELAAGKKIDPQNPYEQKLGDFWATCMDEAALEKSADADIKSLLAPVDAVSDVASLAKLIARVHMGAGAPLFHFDSQQDFKNAELVIGVADQGGLGLPERDYYLKEEPRLKKIREQYVEHVAKVLELAGTPAADAVKQAQIVMRIETRLAQISMPIVDRRDPKKIYHRIELTGLEQKAPKFPWKSFFAELGHPGITQINVAVPEFFAGMSDELGKTPIADWKVYLRWHVLHGASQALSKKFVDEHFRFYGKTLQGTDKIEPRWKRCVKATDWAMGEALARPFVAKYFAGESKADTQATVKAIEATMEKNLGALTWMDEATRGKAMEKLHAIANKIGYPDKWRNYDKLAVARKSLLANVLAAHAFEHNRDLDKIGKPVDRGEWEMSPPTVNAYYEPSLNEMVFPAGILQPPFYARTASAAANFGAIGMVMGHELTHGFDDEGRQFDAKGNLTDWWSPKVSAEFDKRAQCVVDQYNGFVAVDEEHVNGKLTLGENIADLGGVKLAHAAFRAAHPKPAKVGAFTDDQVFFLGFAQSWCGNRRDEYARVRVKTDPHSPARWRVNGPLSNLPDFAAAFACKSGAKMVRATACTIW